ncbi:MAG: hypothetical protein WDZ59_16915 [Pirellulales bacterium]
MLKEDGGEPHPFPLVASVDQRSMRKLIDRLATEIGLPSRREKV